MASTLFYYNHQQQHNLRLGRHPLLSTSSSSTTLPSPAASSSSSSPSAASEYSTLSSNPLAGAGAATAASTHSPSHPQPHHHHYHQPSLSSWAEWPSGQKPNRQLGSGTTTGAGSEPGVVKGASPSTRSAARSRRCLASSSPRHSRQRPGQHMYKPTTVSASPPSLLCCSSGSNSSISPSPGAAHVHPPMTSSANNTAKNNTETTTVATTPTSNTASGASTSTMSDGSSRPSKRSTDGSTPDDSASQAAGKLKLPRLERGPDDFSNVVKNRLQSYTRTGQACDRCKVRKIRCDALPEGCSHCANLGLECYVTDRVTGRTERRGYMQQLEREKSGMLSHIRDLEKLLGENGVDVKPWQGPASMQHNPEESPEIHPPPSSSSSAVNDWAQTGPVWMKSKSPSSNSPSATAPISLRPRLHASGSEIEEQPQATGSEMVALKSIKGTQLRILDMTFDATDFEVPDMDEPSDPSNPPVPLYKRSYQAFLQSTYKINPVVQLTMPSRHDAFTFCDWYFIVFSPYFPLLHKPTFMRLVERIYDEPGFEPSASEHMTLHIIFAIIYHNYGARNWQLEGRIHFTTLADKHYHFALSKFYEVLCARDLPAVQAFILLAIYMRSFPKPGCVPAIVNIALQKALDLGLHRKDETADNGTNLTKELRKRAWWSLVSVSVFTLGRLGRPMIITLQEFDTEIPEPIADERLNENGVDAEQTTPCPFEIGIALQKLTKIMIEVYTHLYSARRDLSQYTQVVEVLDEKLHEWDAALPDCLRPEKTQQLETLVQAYYTKMFFLEVRLCLRHPSLAPAAEKQLREENMRITEATSREMLNLAMEVIKFRAIDTTWYHISLFVVCIFSTLAVHWERRFESSPEQLAALKDEMGLWTVVIKDLSILMGSGTSLLVDISRIVDRTISWIEHDMRGLDFKTSQYSPPPMLNQGQSLGHPGFGHSHNISTTLASSDASSIKNYFGKNVMASQAAFPAVPYGDQSQNVSAPAYSSDQAMFYNTSAQSAAATVVTVAPEDASIQLDPLNTFTAQAAQNFGPPSHPDMVWHSRGPTWNDWEHAPATNHDRYSNSTLLSTGGAGSRAPLSSNDTAGQGSVEIPFIPNSQWPMNLFDPGPDGGPHGV